MKKIVLIVDDHELLRRTFSVVVEKFFPEYQGVTKNDGAQALEFYQENADNIVLVLTDYQMPSMDGAELIRKIRELKKNVAIVFMSGNPKSVPQDVLPFCDMFAEKPPQDIRVFVNLVSQTLDSRKL